MDNILKVFNKHLEASGGSVQLQRKNAETGKTYRADSPEEIDKANFQLRTSAIAKLLKDCTPSQKYQWALNRKHEANELYMAKDFDKAIPLYLDAIVGLDLQDKENSENMQSDIQLPVLTNLAACYLHKQEHAKVIKLCTEAISLRPDCLKAFKRRGQSFLALGEFSQAKSDFQKAKELDPNFPITYIQQLRVKYDKHKARVRKQKKVLEKSFQTSKGSPEAGLQMYRDKPDVECRETKQDEQVDYDALLMPPTVGQMAMNVLYNLKDCLTCQRTRYKFE